MSSFTRSEPVDLYDWHVNRIERLWPMASMFARCHGR